MAFAAPDWKDAMLAALAAWRDDAAAAACFLTRLPLAGFASAETGLPARSMRAFPVVGILVGLVGWAAFAIAAVLAVAATVLVTGALHEDGLADTADGLGGGTDRARKLAIMRDSRTGAYGVLALVLSVALRAGALSVLTTPR